MPSRAVGAAQPTLETRCGDSVRMAAGVAPGGVPAARAPPPADATDGTTSPDERG